MNKLHKIIAASLLASATTAGSGVVLAESPLTANITATSNYIFRGVEQASGVASVQGGIDYAHESGFYVGGWWSSLENAQYEQDIYAGYGFKAGPVDLDVGYIKYMYPVGTAQLDVDEAYINASFDMFNAGLALTTSTEAGGQDSNTYMYVGAEFEVKKGLTLGLTYGDFNYDDAASTDYSHIQVSLSKGEFTFAIDDNDLSTDAGDPRVSVSWNKSFDL